MEIQAFCSYLQLFSRNKPEIQMLDNSWNFFFWHVVYVWGCECMTDDGKQLIKNYFFY